MAKLGMKAIQELARVTIQGTPGGIRYSPLVRSISDAHPETPINTIHGAVWDLDKTFAGKIAKPSRGLFAVDESSAPPPLSESANTQSQSLVKENDFYESFADWIKTDLDEATEAVELGGAGLRGKWGTPDVVGIYKPVPSNRIKFDPEIISAEIKTSLTESITAFGQACAYRLFSHKVYLAMPETVSESDQSRIEALCLLFGIGFVLFHLDVQQPRYRVRVRAQRFAPDMFYVNEFADRLHDHNRSVFNRLFQ